MSVAESWDRRESNLKKRGHLLTAAELKRRGITRYDAEMLLSQGFSLPEPKNAASSPVNSKSRLKSSTPTRCSPRTQCRVLQSSTKSNQPSPTAAGSLLKSTPTSAGSLRKSVINQPSPTSAGPLLKSTPVLAGSLRKSVTKRMMFVRQNQKRHLTRPRTANRRLKFSGSRRLRQSAAGAVNNLRTRRATKQAPRLTDLDGLDFGDDEEDDSSLESSSGCRGYSGRRDDVDIALSMSCDDIVDSNSSLWILHATMNSPTSSETVLTPSKLRTRPRHLPAITRSSDEHMPLLKKEFATSNETAIASLVSQTKLRSADQTRGDDMPVLEKEQYESLSAFGPDSSIDSGWTSSADKAKSSSSLAHRCRRHLDVADRRFGYDTREWRVPKLTIRRRQASGQSSGNCSGLVSSTSSLSSGRLIYEILPTRGSGGSVDSQPPSDDSYSDQKSTTASSSPDSISPSCFYSGGTAGTALKRLRLKFGEESVAIDVGRS